MKNSNNTIGNLTRELPACIAVRQELRNRVPWTRLPKYTKTFGLRRVKA